MTPTARWLLVIAVVLGAGAGVGACQSNPRDMYFGTDAGAGFDAPPLDVIGSSGSGGGSGGFIGGIGTGGASGTAGVGGAPVVAGTGGGGGGGSIVTADCAACEASSCANTGCAAFADGSPDRGSCDALVACIRTSPAPPNFIDPAAHCDQNGGAISSCYCGVAGFQDCVQVGIGNGACKAEMEAADPHIAAMGTSATMAQKAMTVFLDLSDSTIPLGRATGLITCDAQSCSVPCAHQF